MIRFLTTTFSFFIPGGFFLAASIFTLHKGYLTPWLSIIAAMLPYIILSIGLLLGLRFHRSRLAFAILILILTERILHYYGPGGAINSEYGEIILHVSALLLPINMAFLYFAKERGILNITGLFHLIFFAAQPVFFYILLRKKIDILHFINQQIIPAPFLLKLHIPQMVLLLFCLVLLGFLAIALISKKTTPRGLFWALLTCALAFTGFYFEAETSIYFSIAGCIIVLSVIETVYAMAYNDELTGLPGRRALNTTLHNLGKHYTIAMIDIDFFKKFNDRYGHDVGDQVLCMVASHIARIGGGGKPFRYGGEEFTVVFPGKAKKQIKPFLENLRQNISQAKFRIRRRLRPKNAPKKKRRVKNPRAVSVTVSIGAAEPNRNYSKPDEVLKAADKALYRAKRKGRNCVIL